MLVGISALTTIGLRRYYAEQVDLPAPTRSAAAPGARRTPCCSRRPARPGADGLRRRRGLRGGRGGARAGAVPGARTREPRRAPTPAAADVDPVTFARRDRDATSTTCSPPTARSPTTFDARRLRRRRPRRRRHRDLHGLADRPAADARPAARRRQDLPQPRRPGHRRRPSRRWCSACTCSASSGSWSSRTPAARWPPRHSSELRDAGRRVGRAGRVLAALRRRRGPGGRARATTSARSARTR